MLVAEDAIFRATAKDALQNLLYLASWWKVRSDANLSVPKFSYLTLPEGGRSADEWIDRAILGGKVEYTLGNDTSSVMPHCG